LPLPAGFLRLLPLAGLLAVSGAGPLAVPGAAAAQQLTGTLTVGGVPADSGTVILHRVTPEAAGPVDSVRVSAAGEFVLDLGEMPGDGGAMFFATYRHQGVLFFGVPVSASEQLDEPYEIAAWPSRPVPVEPVDPAEAPSFRVAFRNIFIEEGPEGWRVTDVFEVGHEDAVTWISPDRAAGVAVWTYPLPATARNVQSAEIDVSPEDVRLDRGAIEVFAPFPPGDRLFVVRYDLPSLQSTIPMPGVSEVVELLVREPAPAMRVEGLRADAPLEIERGSVYRRWWAEGTRDIAPRILLGEEPAAPMAWVAIVLALLLVAVGSWLVLRPGVPGPLPGAGSSPGGAASDAVAGRERRTRRTVLLEIAHLDEEVEAGRLGEQDAERRRTALLEELEDR
jgi:hypothetical protein